MPRFVFEGPLPTTLQVFSVKIRGRSQEDPNWPLQVYGLIAVRDFVDPQRNVIFNRNRDDCQILNKEVCTVSYIYIYIFIFVIL